MDHHVGNPTFRRRRILLSEGSSLSARQAITTLGLAGHEVEVCDPAPICIGRFSRFVRRFHRCPGLGRDPVGYLDFLLDLLAREKFDVLLPTHEQGYLLAKVAGRLAPLTGIALPAFEDYVTAHGKAGFSRLLTELRLPQPHTEITASAAELRRTTIFPAVVKTGIGTASRGVRFVRNPGDLEQVAATFEKKANSTARSSSRPWRKVRSSGHRPSFVAGISSAPMPTGRSSRAWAAATRSRKASAGHRSAPISRKSASGCTGTVHFRLTTSLKNQGTCRCISTATRGSSSR
jgi:hypothetical protein